MSKTYTAKEFKTYFYRAMLDWVNSGEMGESPEAKWEYSYHQWQSCGKLSDGEWLTPKPYTPGFSDQHIYRWKPAPKRTVVIDGVELVAPETVAPKIGDAYFVEISHGNISNSRWDGDYSDNSSLATGKVFLTEKDAQAMAYAQRKQRLGVKNESSYRL